MKSSKDDFASRFGLRDLEQALTNTPDDSMSSNAPTGSMAAPDLLYRTVGRFLVRFLSSRPNKEAALFDALEQMNASAEELLPVARWLEGKGYIKVLERPKTGNWKLRAEEKAQDLI